MASPEMQQAAAMQQMVAQMSKMSVEERNALIAKMPPEARQQVAMMQREMQDMGTFLNGLKPESVEKADEPVDTFAVINALAQCPSMRSFGDNEAEASSLDALEAALVEEKAFELTQTAELDATVRRAVLLLYWQLYAPRLEGKPEGGGRIKLEPGAAASAEKANERATGMLVKGQMIVPRQLRLVQPVLAVARVSALLVNHAWSHTDDAEGAARMAETLKADGLPVPVLRLTARAGAKENGQREVLPSRQVQLDVELHRDHAELSAGGDGKPGPAVATNPLNPAGILEAYWLFIEGKKPPGTPNSLIQAAPLVVKSLDTGKVPFQMAFGAPAEPGVYTLSVHLLSTSVIGIELSADASFEVVTDDCPPLM